VFLVSAAGSLSCAELATSTDDGAVNRQTPVSIQFTPSLTYAEKLLLKKGRRMELPTSEVLSTSRSCDSGLELGHNTPRDSRLDNPAGCRADVQSELALIHNSSKQSMHFSMRADSYVNFDICKLAM